MKKLCSVMTLAAMLAPSLAVAESFPRDIMVDGLRCTEMLGSKGDVEVWCRTSKGFEKMERFRRGDGRVELRLPSPETDNQRYEPASYTRQRPSQNANVADILGTAAVKYSWSGPLKWSAITLGAAGVILLTSEEGTGGGYFIAASALTLVIALIIDSSARSDVERAAAFSRGAGQSANR